MHDNNSNEKKIKYLNYELQKSYNLICKLKTIIKLQEPSDIDSDFNIEIKKLKNTLDINKYLEDYQNNIFSTNESVLSSCINCNPSKKNKSKNKFRDSCRYNSIYCNDSNISKYRKKKKLNNLYFYLDNNCDKIESMYTSKCCIDLSTYYSGVIIDKNNQSKCPTNATICIPNKECKNYYVNHLLY
jgi:hypothetical protein